MSSNKLQAHNTDGGKEVIPRVFVFGCPRSGTTITRRLIGQHRQIRDIPNESHLFTSGHNAFGSLLVCQGRKEGLNSFCEVFWNRLFNRTTAHGNVGVNKYCDMVRAREAIKKLRAEFLFTREPHRVLRQFMDDIFLGGRPTYVEKTPGHIFWADKIRAIYPDAVFVITNRNEEDILESLSEKSWAPRTSEARKSYVAAYKGAEDYVIRTDPRTITVCMEDLAKDLGVLISPLTKMGIPERGFDWVERLYAEKFDADRLLRRCKRRNLSV